LASPRTWETVRFTFWQAALSTVLTVVIALPGAWALARLRFRGSALVRAVLTVPFVLPTVVVASAFVSLSRSSFTAWASSGLAAIFAAHVFFNYALVARVVGAAWGEMHPDLASAARTLGARPATVFTRVTLPYLRPATAAAAAIVFLFTFTSFGVVLILGGTRWTTLEVEIYRRTAQLFDLPAASALSLLQMVAVGLCLLVISRLGGHGAGLETAGRRTEASGIRPPRWRLAAALAPAILLIGVPLLALVSAAFSNEGGTGLAHFRALGQSRAGTTRFVSPMEAIANSATFAAFATATALAVGGIAALVIAGRAGRRRSAYDTALMLPLGTSAVTLGFGLLIAFDAAPLDLRSSVVLIPVAHALVGIPFVVRTLVPALRTVPQGLRDTALLLGRSPWGVARRVDLPLVGRSALVGAGFAAAVSLGEFGATAFLSRPDRPTLPIAIYRFLGQPGSSNRGQALALSVILMGLVATVVLLTEGAGLRGARAPRSAFLRRRPQ
jgi:thiamine transport system permease protein